jgi:hypothetical protein
MPTDSDLSDKRLTANRKNAQHSTGPSTEAGKAISARNALTLGLFTKRDYVRREEQAEYNDLCARCVTELNPEGVLEETWVAAIVAANWRLRRCSIVERTLVSRNHQDPMIDGYDERIQNSVDRARSHASLLLRRSTIELRHLQNDRALARKLLSEETDLPALASAKQIVVAIDQHHRAQAQQSKRLVASNCSNAHAAQVKNSSAAAERMRRLCSDLSKKQLSRPRHTEPGRPLGTQGSDFRAAEIEY